MKKLLIFAILVVLLPVAVSADIRDEPAYYLYSSAQKYCSITSGVSSRAVDYPSLGWFGTERIGVGQCQAKRKNCVGPDNPSINDFLADSTGRKIIPTEKHTGDTAFCNDKAVEVTVGCGVPYAVDADPNDPATQRENFDQTRLAKWPKGNYCDNRGNANGAEADNNCRLVNHRPDVSFSSVMASLNSFQPTDIYEGSISDWAKNDPFDPTGGLPQIKSAFSDAQQTYYDDIGAGRNDWTPAVPELALDDLDRIEREFLSKGDPVAMALKILTPKGNIDGYHEVILLDAKKKGDGRDLLIADSNAPGGLVTYNCELKDVGQEDHGYVCTAPAVYSDINGQAGQLVLLDWSFDENLTIALRDKKHLVCSTSGLSTTYKNLCARGKANDWVAENIKLFGQNIITPGLFGSCFGWSTIVLKIAYLANFSGERPVDGQQAVCASGVAGEENTFACTDNKTPCVVEWKARAANFVFLTESSFGFCGYKSRPTVLPTGSDSDNLFGAHFQLGEIAGCDGVERPIEKKYYKVFTRKDGTLVNYLLPIYIFYTAKPVGGSAKPSVVKATGDNLRQVWSSLVRSARQAKEVMLSAVSRSTVTIPTCEFSEKGPDGDIWQFVYRNGYIFSHPPRLLADADYQVIDETANIPLSYKTDVKAFNSDLVYSSGSNMFTYWRGTVETPKLLRSADLSLGYFENWEKYVAAKGISTSCRQTAPLPARFQDFLTKVGADKIVLTTDITVKVMGPGTVLYGGQTLVNGQSLKLTVVQQKPIPLVAQTNPTKTYQVSEIAPGIPRTLYYRGVEWQGSGCRDFQFTCPNTGGVTTCEATTTTCYLTPRASSTVTVTFREVSLTANVSSSIKTADLEIKSLFSNKPNNLVPPGGAITVSSGVRNLGTQATTTKLIWYLDGVVVQKKQGTLLVPATTVWQTGAKTGSLTDIYLPWEVLRVFTPGQHILTLKADPDNLIKEMREDNNQASLSFTLFGTSVADALRLTTPTEGTVLLPNSPFTVTWSGNVPQVILIFSKADGSGSQYLTPETDPVTHRHGLPALPATYTTTTPATPGDYLLQIFKFNALAPAGTGAEIPIDSALFSVIGPPVISSFTVSPPQGLPGMFTFHWLTGSAVACTMAQTGGSYSNLPVWPPQSFDPRTKTELTLPLQTSGDFLLTCTNGQTETRKTVSVYVNGSWKPDTTAGTTVDNQTGIVRLLSLVSDWPGDTKRQGENITLRAVIENTGGAAAQNVRLDWYHDGRLIKSPIITIPAHSRYENKVEVALALPKPAVGLHRVRLYVTFSGQKQDLILNYTVTAPTSFVGKIWANVLNSIKN